MNKVFDKARSAVATSAKKFTNVSVNRGKTAYPKASKDLENLGIRWDFDGEVEASGIVYNKFQVQPNPGKFHRPSASGVKRTAEHMLSWE
jgi:hypothetical protein